MFDQAQELVTCGAGLILLANGLAALRAISPELLAHVCTAGKANKQDVKHRADGMPLLLVGPFTLSFSFVMHRQNKVVALQICFEAAHHTKCSAQPQKGMVVWSAVTCLDVVL